MLEDYDIMSLLGVEPKDQMSPIRMRRIQEIISYFKDKKNARRDILKILSKDRGDKIDTVWTWAQLQQEKNRVLKSVDRTNLDEEVVSELDNGHLTIEARRRLKNDAQKRKEELKQRMDEIRRTERDEAKREKQLGKIKGSLGELDKVEKQIDELEGFEVQLDFYD